MNATIITIGDEMLIGQIVDTNSAYIARELTAAGVEVTEILTIGDGFEEILSAFAKAEKQSHITITTGGLGPTKDDLTKDVICYHYNDKLVKNQKVLAHVEEIFNKYVKQPIVQMNRDQALVPSKADVLFNKYGTAPGIHMSRSDRHLFCLPGVPLEMKTLISEEIIPLIKTMPGRDFLHHRTLLTVGVGESTIATRIVDFENALPENVKLAYLPSLGSVRLRLSSKGQQEDKVRERVDSRFDQLREMLSDIEVGEEAVGDLPSGIVTLLKDRKLTLATAESLTGGGVAQNLTAVPGASAVFRGSTVTYATETKAHVLDIPLDEIYKHDVVSEYTAAAMAEAARRLFNSDYALATTGNAGPTQGDSAEKVGTVYIGVAGPHGTEVKKFNFGNNRERTTGKTITKALELLRTDVLEKYAK